MGPVSILENISIEISPMKNIECFNIVASHVLLRLLEEFPKPLLLNSSQLQEEMTDLPECCKWKSQVYHNLTSCTVRFLVEEGYVRVSDGKGSVFSNAVLTSKGFSALNRKLDMLEPGKTLAAKLREAGKAIAPEVAGAIIASFLHH